jgi:hypothetical protein
LILGWEIFLRWFFCANRGIFHSIFLLILGREIFYETSPEYKTMVPLLALLQQGSEELHSMGLCGGQSYMHGNSNSQQKLCLCWSIICWSRTPPLEVDR